MDLQPVVTPAARGSIVEPAHGERSHVPRKSAPGAPDHAMAVRLQTAIDRANGSMSRDLDISSDPDTQRMVMRIVDRDTGQVIRQFPSVEALAIAQDIDRQRSRMLQRTG